jgi:hypothetical protein
MMNGVPALRTLGWQITVDPEFPYRIAGADDWYADLQTTRPAQANCPRGAKQSRSPARFDCSTELIWVSRTCLDASLRVDRAGGGTNSVILVADHQTCPPQRTRTARRGR